STVDGMDAVDEPGKAGRGRSDHREFGAAAAVVAHNEPEPGALLRARQGCTGRVRVLGDVGQELGGAEVRDGFDGGTGPLAEVDRDAGRDWAAGGQGGQGAFESH